MAAFSACTLSAQFSVQYRCCVLAGGNIQPAKGQLLLNSFLVLQLPQSAGRSCADSGDGLCTALHLGCDAPLPFMST